MSAAVRRPALRYHGGKFLLAPWVIRHLPRHRKYTEAFCGAASVLMRKPRVYSEAINDLDDDIVSFFRVLQDPHSAARLAELLYLTPFSRSEWRRAYEPTADPIERARRTVCRSFMGFGSDSLKVNRQTGFRSNSSRSGTTPSLDWSRYPAEIPKFVERIRGVMIDQKPAADMLLEHDSAETLHYVDPPYPHSTRSDIRGYTHELLDDDHRDLAAVLRGLKGFVVLSGYRCDLYDDLFGDWIRVDRDVIVFRATRRVESLWLSPRTAAALDPQLPFGADL
jgi:DNA adenine methylase